jgi:hypothetical protein
LPEVMVILNVNASSVQVGLLPQAVLKTGHSL